MTEMVGWEAKHQKDGTIDLYVRYEDGMVEKTKIRLPIGVSEIRRDLYFQGVLLSLSNEREARRAKDALRLHIEQLKARIDRQESVSPPALAELFISLLAPKNTAQALLGDLQEMFQKNVERLDEKQARRKYWMQVVASAGPLLLQWVKRIGLVTLLVDYFRSKFGL